MINLEVKLGAGWAVLMAAQVEGALGAEQERHPTMLAESGGMYGTPAQSGDLLQQRCYELGIVIVKACRVLRKLHDYEIASQLIRCGTNPGAMVQDLTYAESVTDRRHKVSVALKEAAETRYWICLCRDTDAFDGRQFAYLIDHVNPVISLLCRRLKANK